MASRVLINIRIDRNGNSATDIWALPEGDWVPFCPQITTPYAHHDHWGRNKIIYSEMEE